MRKPGVVSLGRGGTVDLISLVIVKKYQRTWGWIFAFNIKKCLFCWRKFVGEGRAGRLEVGRDCAHFEGEKRIEGEEIEKIEGEESERSKVILNSRVWRSQI